jgi:dolichol-phosphate mannosyltransferase
VTLSDAAWGALAIAQAVALVVLFERLQRGRRRIPPVAPRPAGLPGTSVSLIVPTYNEAARIGACLDGLRAQNEPLGEVIVVDSRSHDDTAALVRSAAQADPRIRLVEDPPTPSGWVGKVWALQHALGLAQGEWILGMDADTRARPGLVAGTVDAAQKYGYDVVSFAPRFGRSTAAEQFVQVSMLVALVYRSAPTGQDAPPADRVLANGQCFLARRAVLLAHGGYAPARGSWADDVTLARHLARAGVRVGFLDGSLLYTVAAYSGPREVWREWGRSFDLSDATTKVRQWSDVGLIVLAQGMPLVTIAACLAGASLGGPVVRTAVLTITAALLGLRVAMLFALRASYQHQTAGYWLSPLSDPLATLRLILSTVRRPTSWRGRSHVPAEPG